VIGPNCTHCSRPAELVTGKTLYPLAGPSLAGKMFWRCAPCGAHVGCHAPGNGFGDGTRPLGTLANSELRRARNSAHAAFDPIWDRGSMSRRDAYAWLARELGIEPAACHIAMFDLVQCRRVVELVKVNPRASSPKAAVAAGPMRIFTDGSCYPNPGPGGWAFVAQHSNGVIEEFFGSQADTTNNRMELLAIVKALEWAAGRPCEIFSDSQLCVSTLTTWAQGWKKRGWRKADGGEPMNLDMVQPAYDLFLRSKAKISWVRGHAGNELNERADVLAGMGRAQLDKLTV
jgi:ribonuclease HI